MPRRTVSVALPVAVVLALLGTRTGAVLGAVPPTPTVSLPTVTVPVPVLPPAPVPVPVPLPPPPPIAVPPKVETTPVPATPPPLDLPAPVPPAVSSSAPAAPALRGGAASSRYYVRELGSERARKRRPAKARAATRPNDIAGASVARAPRVKGVSASVQGPVPEDGGFLGPISTALSSLGDPAKAIPGALFAMALLAVLLLAVASMPVPLRTTRASAMLVHKRGSIAAAGVASLGMALAAYLLL